MFFMDDSHEIFASAFNGRKMALTPSEYIKKHCHFSIIRDPVAVEMADRLPLDNIMWGTDFPHSVGSFPHSQEFLDKTFAGKDALRRKITLDNPARVGIGISLDEIHRVNNRRAMPYEQPVYPLLEHDPPLRRRDCESIIAAAGLPVPGKSACWFVPTEATRVLERATPRPAGPVRTGLPVGGPTQSAPHRAGQAPGVVDRPEPAAAHHPRGAGHAARLQR